MLGVMGGFGDETLPIVPVGELDTAVSSGVIPVSGQHVTRPVS